MPAVQTATLGIQKLVTQFSDSWFRFVGAGIVWGHVQIGIRGPLPVFQDVRPLVVVLRNFSFPIIPPAEVKNLSLVLLRPLAVAIRCERETIIGLWRFATFGWFRCSAFGRLCDDITSLFKRVEWCPDTREGANFAGIVLSVSL